MKKFNFIPACIILFCMEVNAQYYYNYNRLSVNDPQRSWYYNYNGSITEASLNIKPHGTYLEYDLYLTFSAALGTSYYGSTSSYDNNTQLELVLNFNLPDNSFITDSWLWVGSDIMQAIIMDKWTARNIYEGIVNRRKDPSILYKTGLNNYELRVYPIKTIMKRKVKISYMVPFTFGQRYITAALPTNILNCSKTTVPSLKVTVFPGSTSVCPVIFENPEVTFSKVDANYTATIPSSLLKSSVNVSLINPSEGGLFFNIVKKGDDKYYQMAFIPSALTETIQKRKLAVVIDYDPTVNHTYYSYDYYIHAYTYTNSAQPVTLDQMLKATEAGLMAQLSEYDSINVFYNRNACYTHWIPADSAHIHNCFLNLKLVITKKSLAPTLVKDAIQFIQKHDSSGSILLVTNSDDYCQNATTLNPIINEISDLVKPGSIPVHIVDVSTSNDWVYINNASYSGSEYLYSNISRLTLGNYFSSRKSNETLSILLQKSMQQLEGHITNFDYHLSMENGFCYSRMQPGSSEDFFFSQPVVEVGKFEGDLPFILEINCKIDTTYINKSITIDQNLIDKSVIKTDKIWAGNYIIKMEKNQVNYTDDIAQIIKASIDNRVLSNYTTFLALEPSDSIHACDDCSEYSMDKVADGYTSGSSMMSTDLKDEKTDSIGEITIYPNPFAEKTTISINLTENAKTLTVDLYNLQGQMIRNLYHSENIAQQTIEIEWLGDDESGNPVAPGMYLIVIKTDSGQETLKIVRQ